jgi:gamma-glutamyl:cysteine ligase YbdK (ATP-grasp superfamily)
MTPTEPEFTLGIEEEYFLVDRATRDVVDDPPPAMLADCEALLAGQVSPEFLRSQIEIGTRVCASLAEARADLRHLRRTVAAVAARHGMAPGAAGTRRKPPSADATPICATICKASSAASRSAGCMSISASPTTNCVSIC